jgi:serine/threonine protein kinase/tetratricopeptide (TPR) repeat protein
MNAERWRQVDELLEAALEREASERSDFLKRACTGDEELLREVESLLAAHLKAGSFIEASPAEDMTRLFDRDQVQSIVGKSLGRYKILSLIGAGGMGEVYLAEDTSLGRRVAIKLLPAFFARDPQSRNRFLREAKLAATLDHPNICTVHEVGQASGYHFIAMQYVEGKTLGEVIGGAPLNINALLSISLQVAHALATAHAAGIIHRDIKPGNIVVTQSGQVKVLDFGLAKLVEDQEGLDADKLTQTGVALGTPAYMSPEQARGERADARSDIFSLGVAFYEMATGRVPFKGKSQHETLNAVINQPHRPLAELNKEVPPELADLIDRALAKDPKDRHHSMHELIEHLWKVAQAVGFSGSTIPDGVAFPYVAPKQRMGLRLRRARLSAAQRKSTLATLIVTSLVLAAAAVYLVAGNKATGSGSSIHSVAVMPIANAGAEPEMEYLADGITESIINNLSQLSNLKVMSRSSVFRYKGKEIDPQAVASELKVQAVVVGQIIAHGDNISIALEMVDATDNHQLWGQRYDRKISDLLHLQGDISQDISSKLRLKLSSEEQKLITKQYTENNEAYQLYLRGRFWVGRRTEDGYKKAIGYFNQAIERDPNYALAYSGLSDSYGGLSDGGFLASKEGGGRAKDAAKKALAIDDQLAEAHTSLAALMCFYDWDFAGAEPEYRRAIALNPNSSMAHYLYGSYLSIVGRQAEAVAEKRRAQELEPSSIVINFGIGWALYRARQYDQAIEALRQTLDMDRSFGNTFRYLGLAYLKKGAYDEAISALQEAVKLDPSHTGFIANLGYAYAMTGRNDETQKLLEVLRELSTRRYVAPYDLALIYAGLGDKDQAFTQLEKAREERSNFLAYLKGEPAWDGLRSDSRFENLLRGMEALQ